MKSIDQPLKVFFLFLFVFTISTKRAVSSWNDASRMATIQSLVETRSLSIDETIFEEITSDTYLFQGETFSSKPPALAFLGSAVYSPLYVLGITFTEDPAISYFIITLGTIGILSALGLVFFWKILVEFFGNSREWASVVTVVAGIGTLILPYSTVFSSHVVCGALMILGFYASLKYTTNYEMKYIVFTGVLFSLAGSIDTSCMIFLPFVFLIFLRISMKSGFIFIAACLPFLSFYFVMNLMTSGSLLPPTLNAPLRSASGSTFSSENLSGLTSHENLADTLTYTYHSILGRRGLISHTPILIFALYGLFVFIRTRRANQYFIEYLSLLLASAFYIGLILFRTNNYSGNAFGIRWFAAVMLILMLSLTFIEKAIRSRKYFRFAFWLVSALSITIAVIGSYRPFLPSARPVIGDPSIVENTIILGIERLMVLASLEGRIRTILLLVFSIVIFVYLAREFSTVRVNPEPI
jgi:hypothetical protein